MPIARRTLARLLAAGCMAAACAGFFAVAAAAAAERGDSAETRVRKQKEKAEELARIHARIAEVNKSIEVDRDQQDALRSAVEAAERKVVEAQGAVRKVQAQIEAQALKVKQAQDDRADADSKLGLQKQALASQLRAAYMLGTGGKTELLLSQEEPDRLGRMLTYYDYVNRARKRDIEAISADIDRVAQLQKQYQAQLDQMRALQAQRRTALTELESDRYARKQAMTQLQTRIASEGQELKRLQGSEKQIQSLLDSLNRQASEAPLQTGAQRPFPEMRGRLQWPLRGPLLARYGEAKAGKRLVWKGLWIGSPEGTPIRVCAAGRVAYVGWLSSFGLIMVVEHEGNYFSLYAHNATVARAAGDSVAAGEVIATVGNTGGYEETGLYFEIRKGTDSLDPKDWLAR